MWDLHNRTSLSDLLMCRLISLLFTCLYSLLRWNWNMSVKKSHWNMFSILRPMENDVRFEYDPWKMPDCVSFPLFEFTLVIKLRNYEFESHLNTIMFLTIKYMTSNFQYVSWKSFWFYFIYIVWVHFIHKTEKFRSWKSFKYSNSFS